MKTLYVVAILATVVTTASAQQYMLDAVAVNSGGARIQSGSYTAGLSFGQQTASEMLTAGQYRATLGFWHAFEGPDGVAENVSQSVRPLAFRLGQNAPNPFSRLTTIDYTLPCANDVALRVYSSAGRVVTTLVSGRQRPGRYSVSWDVSGVPAAKLPCGTYFCRLEAGEFTATRKMVKSE